MFMEPQLELHWYPGHMAKARRQLQSRWRLVDVVLEVVDARAPETSRHPEPVEGVARRPRVLLLAKADLADKAATKKWLAHYRGQDVPAWAGDLREGQWVRPVSRMLRQAGRVKARASGTVRVLVAGLPNVGKSTAINSLSRRAKAQTGGRPGTTRALQWLDAGGGLQLLDSPGVLWPEKTEGRAALFLAALGSVPDAVFDDETVAELLLRYLLEHHPAGVLERYRDVPGDASKSLLETVARQRGMLQAGGVPDRSRAAAAVLHDFRTGRLGRLTLERPAEGSEDGADDGAKDGVEGEGTDDGPSKPT